MSKRYLEDLAVGQRFSSGTYALETAQIKAFATEFDPQRFHLDEAAAADTIFRGLAASGWQTAAVTMKLLVESGLPLADGIVGVGIELAWPLPTRPGDVLQVESEVMEILPSRSKPGQAIVVVRSQTRNQSGQTVQNMTSKLLVFARAAGPSGSSQSATKRSKDRD